MFKFTCLFAKTIISIWIFYLEIVYSNETNNIGRIIGGSQAHIETAPYIASLFLRQRSQLKLFCAGTLINEKWILSVSHCMARIPSKIIAGAGATKISEIIKLGQLRNGELYIKHSNYTPPVGPFDIALFKVDKPFIFNEFVQPIHIYRHEKLPKSMTVFGWGSLKKGLSRSYPDTLQHTILTPVDNKKCQGYFKYHINNDNFCASDDQNKRGACVGDSGGPIVSGNSLVGLVSWGPNTCDPIDGPTVFTKISSYLPWIKENIDTEVKLLLN